MKTFLVDIATMWISLILVVIFFFQGMYAISLLCAVLMVLIFCRIWDDES